MTIAQPTRRSMLVGATAAPLPRGLGVDPVDLGAIGDGRANDLVAFSRSVRVARERQLPVRITRPHYLGLRAAADSIQLSSGAILSFEGGAIRYDYVGSPLFWARAAKNIEILNADIAFTGRMPHVIPPTIADFYDHHLRRRRPMPGRDLMAAFSFSGVTNLRVLNPRFRSGWVEADTLIPRCISIGDHDNGTPSRNITIENFQADGFYMGVIAWGVDGLTIRGMRVKRWGQLNTTEYGWEAPTHAVYITPLAPSRNVICTDLVDEGQEISPWLGAGSTSFKFTGVVEGLRLARLHSRRSAGLLDFHGRDYFFSDLDWAGEKPEALTANKVIRAISYSGASNELSDGVMRNVRLALPHEMNDYAVALGGGDGHSVNRCRFENWSLILPGARQSSSMPLILGSMSSTVWRDLRLFAPSARNEILALRIDEGGIENRVCLSVRSPSSARVVAGPGNRVDVSRF